MLTKQQMLGALDSLITDAGGLFEAFSHDLAPWTPQFVVWLKASESTIETIYGSRSDALATFRSIYFMPPPDQTFTSDADRDKARLVWFDSGLRFAIQTLVGFRYSIDRLLPDEEQKHHNPFVFISHGGPIRAHVDTVAELLKTIGLSPVIVEDLPNLNLSLNDKVRHYMGLCGAAIVLATLDDDAPAERRTRANISHEIGLLQEIPNIGGRIAYLKEAEVEFPSNYREKGWIRFTRTRAQDAFISLLKELRAFGLVG